MEVTRWCYRSITSRLALCSPAREDCRREHLARTAESAFYERYACVQPYSDFIRREFIQIAKNQDAPVFCRKLTGADAYLAASFHTRQLIMRRFGLGRECVQTCRCRSCGLAPVSTVLLSHFIRRHA